jgi:hypothetical protein
LAEDIGPISASVAGGSDSRTPCSRSATRVRAKYRSTSSSKTMVTVANAYLLTDRTCVTRGSPPIATSIGAVASRSTSTGERPGASTSTCTCTSVRSGNASTRSVRSAHTPAAISARMPNSTAPRLRTAQPISLSIMAAP